MKIQFIAASPSLVDREVDSYETPGGDRRVDWRYRRAHPGEQYESAAVSAQLPGEALHRAGVEGRRIRDILAVLDWWVGGTSPWARGEVLISAVPERPDRGGSARAISRACGGAARAGRAPGRSRARS